MKNSGMLLWRSVRGWHRKKHIDLKNKDNGEKDGNYVMSIEYPRAVELNKKIVPVELLPANRELLLEKYPQLPEIINIYDVLSLEKVCREILKKEQIL